MRRIVRRKGQPSLIVRGAWEVLAKQRWAYSHARAPLDYPNVRLGKVMREDSDVLVLLDVNGNVLTRYRITPQSGRRESVYCNVMPSLAFRLLTEL